MSGVNSGLRRGLACISARCPVGAPPPPQLSEGRQHADIRQGRAVGDFVASCVRQARGRGGLTQLAHPP